MTNNHSSKLSSIHAKAGEKTQYLVHEANDNTIRFALQYPCILSEERLQKAVRAVIGCVPILHSSFVQDQGSLYWQIHSDWQTADFFAAADTDRPLMEEAARIMVQPIPPSAKTQLHCTLLCSQRQSALIFRCSHLCADGMDSRYLLLKIAEAYCLASADGNAGAVQVKNGSRSSFQVFRSLGIRRLLKAVKPSLSGIRLQFPYPGQEAGHARMESVCIDARTANAAHRRAKEYGATMNDLLLTAFYHALAGLPGMTPETPFCITCMMDLRQHCKEKDSAGLCNLTGSLPTALPHGLCGSFEETLKEIAAQTQREKQSSVAGLAGTPLLYTFTAILPFRTLERLSSKLYGNMAIGLTNLGILPQDLLLLDNTAPLHVLFAGPVKKKNGMQISAIGLHGEIVLCCAGEYDDEDAVFVRHLLNEIACELKKFAAS